jgi:hypothetical protein
MSVIMLLVVIMSVIMLLVVIMNVIMLLVVIMSFCTACCCDEFDSPECHSAKCHYALLLFC